MSRLPGHELAYEGAPFTAQGWRMMSLNIYSTSGVGRAKCSCGELSDNLPSANKRKAWHRAHKDEIRGSK